MTNLVLTWHHEATGPTLRTPASVPMASNALPTPQIDLCVGELVAQWDDTIFAGRLKAAAAKPLSVFDEKHAFRRLSDRAFTV